MKSHISCHSAFPCFLLVLFVVEGPVNSLLCDGLSYVLSLGTQIADHTLHGGLVFQKKWSDHALVQDFGAVPRYWSHTPYEEQTLASIVKGEPEEEDVREELNNAEESVNNPVGEPLCVILLNIALDGLNREICWIDKSNQVAE